VVTAAPLHRNRDFLLFQTGLLLSSGGSQMTAIAYPLLVLALTGSPAQAGLVSFARLIPYPLFVLVAGVVVDRLDRRRVMIVADVVRVVAVGSIVAAWLGWKLHLACDKASGEICHHEHEAAGKGQREQP